MGDSDEEYDRRRARDKFRGERSDYERRPRDYRDRRRGGEEWHDRRRDNNWDWNDKKRDGSWDSRKRGGDYYRDTERPRRDSGGRQMSPPMKRTRRDWDSSFGEDYQSYGTGGNMNPGGGPWGPSASPMPISGGNEPSKPNSGNAPSEQGSQIPSMMTFKQFILAQEDDISGSEGLRRFQEYKTEFKRTQISDFFVLHKEEEWFKEKYHPLDAAKHKEEVRDSARQRLRVFLDLFKKGHLDGISLEVQHADDIVQLLDKVVIKLEGGNDNDLAVLDVSPRQSTSDGAPATSEGKGTESNQGAEPLSPSSVPLPDDPPPVSQARAGDRNMPSRDSNTDQRQPVVETKMYPDKDTQSSSKKEKRRKHREPYHYDDDDDDESESESDSDTSEPAPPGEDSDPVGPANISEDEIKEGVSSTSASHRVVGSTSQPSVDTKEGDGDVDANLRPPGVDDEVEPDINSLDEPAPPGAESTEHINPGNKGEGFKRDLGADTLPSTTSNGENHIHTTDRGTVQSIDKGPASQDATSEDSKGVDSTTEEVRTESSRPRALHKTLSLFLRNIPPVVNKGDIVAVCKRYPGFLRVAMADPSPERRFFRRAWITFDSSVNIKDICWNLSNIKIKDTETNPVVNRDLSKRVRAITGITMATKVVHFDLRFCKKLVEALDYKYRLYQPEEQDAQEDDMETEAKENSETPQEQGADTTQSRKEDDALRSVEIPNANPLLELVPVVPIEEEKVVTKSPPGEEKKDETAQEKEEPVDFSPDANVLETLDKLLLYLRIVHSLDYYNGTDYPHEDVMPNRCGIIHIRGPPLEKSSQSEISDWKKTVETKLGHHLVTDPERLTEEEAVKLGKKDATSEVENFVTANTERLAQDKWLCPLSGKKFKGPEFVRKHIFNKHGDKLHAVKTEVEFFNHYLYDPQRPHFPEQAPGRDTGVSGSGPAVNQSPFNPQQPMYQMGWNPRGPHMMYGPRSHFTPPSYGGFRGGHDIHSRGGHTYPPKPRRGGMMRDPRGIITYKDLDAPDDADFF